MNPEVVRRSTADVPAAGTGCVFVVGCPRSGTYLLSLMLSAECGIAIPVETHFIPLFERFLPLFGDLASTVNRRRLLGCIYDFLEIWTPRSEKDRAPEVIRRYSLLATRPSASAIVAQSYDYATLVDALFAHYAALHGSARYGDKSAFFRHVPLQDLADLDRGSKFVHVIRDGRDVALSWLRIWTGPMNLTQSALNWAAHVERKRAWGERHPDRYLEIRYEDLIADPNSAIDQVCRFIGAKRNPDASFHRSELALALAGGGPHSKISAPPDANNKEKWRNAMTSRQRLRFSMLAGKTLGACGYAQATEVAGARERLQNAIVIVYERLRGILSVHEFQLQSKNLLPLAVLICRWLHIPLVHILNRGHPVFQTDRKGR